MTMRARLAATLVALCALAGCTPDPGRGRLGRVHLRFASDNAFVSPYAFRPLMLGTHEGVVMEESTNVPAFTAESADGAVFVVSNVTQDRQCCTGGHCAPVTTDAACAAGGGSVTSTSRIDVSTTGLGAADLVLRVGGADYDRVLVTVAAPASLRLEATADAAGDHADATGVAVLAGHSFYVRATAFDATGAQLEARYGFLVTDSDATVASVAEPGIGHPTPPAGLSAVSFDVSGTALHAGTTTVQFATAGGVSASLPVVVH